MNTKILIISVLSASLSAQQLRIDTVAGGYVPDLVAATSAAVDQTIDVTTDANGNFYFAVPGSNRVFRVDSAGQIRLFAGNGATGFSGDGGPATAASLYYPTGLAVDSKNVYIVDQGNHRVRKVDVGTGVIGTLAGDGRCTFAGDGGMAAGASLCFPFGVALDGMGNLYIGEINNHRVRRVVLSSGIIGTIAGNGTCNPTGANGDGGPANGASLCFPSHLAADGSRSLYVAENATNRVRKIDFATAGISTVAGNGTCVLAGEGVPAADSSVCSPSGVALDRNGSLYITEVGFNRIRKMELASGNISTVAGDGTFGFRGDGASARNAWLSYPYGISVDSNGNLYIADFFNNRIRKIAAATATIATVAGAAGSFRGDGGRATEAALWGPGDIAIDGSQLYIAEFGNRRVRQVDLRSGIIRTVAGTGNAGFNGDGPAADVNIEPQGLAKDGAGNLYISDSSRIWRLSLGAGIMTQVAGNGQSSFSGDGGPALAAGLNLPTGLALDGKGGLYVSDSNHHRVRKIDLRSGTITAVAGTGTAGYNGDGGAAAQSSLNSPRSLALDATGNLYVADAGNHRVRRIDLNTGIIATFAGTGTAGTTGAQLSLPTGVSLDGSGNLLITEYWSDRIRRVNLSTGAITSLAGPSSGFSGDGGSAVSASLYGPFGITVDSSGTIYFADSLNNRVRRISQPAPPASLTLSRAILNFDATSGVQTVALGTSGNSLNFTTSVSTASGGNWLSVSPASGATPATLTVGVNQSGLAAGNYTGAVTITASGATNSPQRIAVGMIVGTPPPSPTDPFSFDRRTVPLAGVTSYAVADFNLDGKPDIVAANASTAFLLLGNGDGSFQPPATIGAGKVALARDFNGDGIPDLVLNGNDSGLAILIGIGDGSFQDPVPIDVRSLSQVVAADFNGDGMLDLSGLGPDGIAILLGNGDGSFQQAIAYAPGDLPLMNLAVGDFDLDGAPDLAVGTVSGGLILLNNGDATFRTPLPLNAATAVSVYAVGDFDLDGKPDLALFVDKALLLILGQGDGTFSTPRFTLPNIESASIAVDDFTGEGSPDLAITIGGSSNIILAQGSGTGGIIPPLVNLPAGMVVQTLAVADFNGDGKPDLIAQGADALVVLVNATI